MCVDFVIGLLFVHDCLLHDCLPLVFVGHVCITFLPNH